MISDIQIQKNYNNGLMVIIGLLKMKTNPKIYNDMKGNGMSEAVTGLLNLKIPVKTVKEIIVKQSKFTSPQTINNLTSAIKNLKKLIKK